MSIYPPGFEDKRQVALDAHVAKQLGISVDVLDDHPYRIEPNIGDDGTEYSWHVFWEDDVPEGVVVHGAPGSQWSDIAVGHFDDDNAEDQGDLEVDEGEGDVPAWFEELQAQDNFEIDPVLLKRWKDLPPEQMIPLQLPRLAVDTLFDVIGSSFTTQQHLALFMVFQSNNDYAKADEAMRQWMTKLTISDRQIRLLRRVLMRQTVGELPDVD